MASLLDDVNELLKQKYGNIERLNHIKETLEKNKQLYVSDRRYITDLAKMHIEKSPEITQSASKRLWYSNKSDDILDSENEHMSNITSNSKSEYERVISRPSDLVSSNTPSFRNKTLTHNRKSLFSRLDRNFFTKLSPTTIALIGLIIIGSSLFASWITLQVSVVSFSVSMADIYHMISSILSLANTSSQTTDPISQIPLDTNVISQIPEMDNGSQIIRILFASLLTIIGLPIVIVLGIIAVSIGKRKLVFITGIFGIMCSISWIYAISGLKSILSDVANTSGGGFGEAMFSGIISSFVSGISFGYGTIIALLGSILLILAFFKK